ncbi:MAG: alkaline phosphatase, partial [Ponticaulis sp.]|nr:alkaline phosphatase [Ponticaulis sp.]
MLDEPQLTHQPRDDSMKIAHFFSGLLASTVLAGCATSTGPAAMMQNADYGRAVHTPKQAADPYYMTARERVAARAEMRSAKSAKNVIIFIGDGMGISTITAGRIYAGQKQGLDGESYQLTMETFPNAALSKTYAHDGQVSDSASTAVAIMSGVKTNVATLGFTKDARPNNCAGSLGHEVESVFDIAENEGLATGIVSTARITHATPGATYAHSASRNWENDGHLGAQADAGCKDIAAQMIDWAAGDGFEIAMGGGRSNFMKSD